MKATEQILSFHRNGRNLYISFQKEPDQQAFRSMSTVLKDYAGDTGRLFLDVRQLTGTVSHGTAHSMQYVLKKSGLPASSVYFKGQAGFSLAGNGNRVLIINKGGRDSAAENEAARKRFVRRTHKCSCQGRCGDKCCKVTGGPCCSEKH